MQTERVTFLTSPDQKAALDAFAKQSGMSVGHLVREATTRYLTEPREEQGGSDEELIALSHEVEAMLPRWHARIDRMEANLDRAHDLVRAALAEVAKPKIDGADDEHVREELRAA